MTSFARFPEILQLGVEAALSADSLLWNAGDQGDDVVLLMEGTVDVVQHDAEGAEVVLRTLGPGAILGEIALDGHRRSAAVRAATPSRVLRIPAGAFRDFLRARPDVLEALFWQQVGLVRSLTDVVVRTHRKSIIDGLTRLYELSYFRDRLRVELERARETADPLAVVIFDVDNMTEYNEGLGREKGNALLAGVADVLRSVGRRGDVIGRFGGEEFVIFLYGAVRDDVRRFAEKVRARVEATDFEGGEQQPLGRVTVSGGAAMFPEDGVRADSLLEAADACVAVAKERGRNRVTISFQED